MDARAWLNLVLEAGWSELFDDVLGGDPLGFPGYREQLGRAREKTGCSESVIVADGKTNGTEVIAIAFEFGFLGGSMGVAAGERICRAFERGAERRVPVVALIASGGARMQEGMLALAQMPATLLARAKLADARKPFIAYLRNPTTGGVWASFASSADLIWAEPGATIGFAGPRVAAGDEPKTAETALETRLIDSIVRPDDLRAHIGDALATTRVEVRCEGIVPRPRDYRAFRRALARAARLHLPIVSFIDTPGADPSAEAEQDGIAREISMTFETLLEAPVPTVACVTGAGGSGGALALAACDRLLIVEDAWFSVIAPQGAAAILGRTDVDQVERDLKLTAVDLKTFGLADRVVTRGEVDAAIAWALDDIEAEGGAPTARRSGRWRVFRP